MMRLSEMIVRGTRIPTVLVALLVLMGSVSTMRAQPDEAPPPPPAGAPPPPPVEAPPPEAPPAGEEKTIARTPVRLSFTEGEVSFWRPGAEDWTAAQINTPLAPGDALYAAAGANLELQIGPRAFARAGADTQLELDNQEPDFQQFKVTSGHASLDLRSLAAGQTVELDTPNAAFTIEATGYYRVDITDDRTTFITRRGGHATMTPAGGEASGIAPSEEAVIEGADTPRVETYAAPELDAWDRWNYDRTDHLIDAVSARYVPPGVYGIDALDHYGTWRTTPDYGSVWVPEHVADDWAPFTEGRWVWDPDYGWSWVDDAPWGWAPCHYGRWVHASGYWAWAPGPLVVAPVYAPAVVAFFGGPHFGVSIGIGAPAVGWVALGWGEPVVPWWGHPGFVGVPSWRGWGGPRVVNNVVIERNTVVNVTNITTYQNVTVRNAVVATREDRFGRGIAERVRVRETDARQLEPLQGRVPVQPIATSLAPRPEHAARPPEAILRRSVVATRPPRDTATSLRAAGLTVENKPAPAPRIVSGPRVPRSALAAPRPPFGQQGAGERQPPAQPPGFAGEAQRRQPEPRREQLAPAVNAAPPAAPSGQQQPQVPQAREAVPRREAPPAVAPQAPQAAPPPPQMRERAVPREVAPPAAPMRQAVPQAAPPPLERRAPAPQMERPGRSLPGEPANRVYRAPPPAMRGSSAPAMPQRSTGSADQRQQRRRPGER